MPELLEKRCLERGGSSSDASPGVPLVDEGRNIRRTVSAALAKRGFEVVTAPTGREALACLREMSFRLLLLDLNLPDLSGLEVLMRVRREMSSLPVVVFTACRGKNEAIRALRLGASEFLEKPLTPDEIQSRNGRLLTRIKRIAPVPGVEVDTLAVIESSAKTVLPDLLRRKQIEQLFFAWPGESGRLRACRMLLKKCPGEITAVRVKEGRLRKVAAFIDDGPYTALVADCALETAQQAGLAELTLLNAQPASADAPDPGRLGQLSHAVDPRVTVYRSGGPRPSVATHLAFRRGGRGARLKIKIVECRCPLQCRRRVGLHLQNEHVFSKN